MKPGQWPGFFSRILQEQKCRQPTTLFTVFWAKADRVEQFRDAADTRSGSAGLGFQKGNLRRRLLVIFVDRSRLSTRALLEAVQFKYCG
jgi:hypothetical protein